jgi:hypothetical protein
MPRFGSVSILSAWLVLACGPDDEPRDRCRLEPTFVVTVTSDTGNLPDDTRLEFTHGSGTEEFDLRTVRTPQVVFCEAALENESTGGAGGAGGAAGAVHAIVCELWTGGATELSVVASGFERVEEYSLRTDRDRCTVEETLELETERPLEP